MSKYGKTRGMQVTIGRLVVQIPPGTPKTDEEVIDREHTIALIEEEIAPHKSIVDVGKEVQTGLREDITACMTERLHADRVPDPKDVPLFKEEAAAMAKEKQRERRPKVVDALPSGMDTVQLPASGEPGDVKLLPAATTTKKARKPRKPRAPREAKPRKAS